jgi:hypothetical protein
MENDNMAVLMLKCEHGEASALCAFDGPHAPGPHVLCDVCGEAACDYCGDYLDAAAYAVGDWRCPDHQET